MALLLGGCAGTPAPVIGPVTAVPVAALGQAGYTQTDSARYTLRPADAVSINVFRETDLSLDKVAVDADGMIAVPMLGNIRAEGMTPAELGEHIRQLLAGGYLVDPRVSVNVVEYGSHQVTVEGAVTTPGIYTFQPGTRLSGAIALGQGVKREARLQQVAVFRNTPEGIAVAKFDYARMQSGEMIDPLLQPGDRVVVGTSTLAQFWQDLLRALPVFGVFYR